MGYQTGHVKTFGGTNTTEGGGIYDGAILTLFNLH